MFDTKWQNIKICGGRIPHESLDFTMLLPFVQNEEGKDDAVENANEDDEEEEGLFTNGQFKLFTAKNCQK